jgi:D-alanyl-lipoteichoic acid acyltransferase DltB (MBOAT superfamily)
MNFANARFWGLLIAGLCTVVVLRLVFAAVRPQKLADFDRVALLALGMFLLFHVNALTFAIWLAVSLGTWAGVWLINKYHPGSGSRYLWILIPAQLAPLFYFKYADFTLNGVLGLGFSPVRDLIIPAGLSFYTFQKVAFAVDTLQNGEPVPPLLDYMNFAGFFPQIVAGPIERKDNLLGQMQQFRFRWVAAEIDEGLSWLVVGLFFKCVMADNLADGMFYFSNSTSNAYEIWAANLLFGLRCYFDFAGYSLVAFGVARCLGVKLTLNFASPLCSTSIKEFWNRWHISLSRWLWDYVFIPLRSLPVALGIGLVFVVAGIWHGAGWNFLLFGCVHGISMVICHFCRKLKIPPILGWLATMAAVAFAFLFFYETRLPALFAKTKTLASPSAYSPHALRELIVILRSVNGTVLLCFLAMAFTTLTVEWLSVRRRNEPYFLLRRPLVLAGLAVLIVLLAPLKSNGFIYFAF